jgi:hypothetical protein
MHATAPPPAGATYPEHPAVNAATLADTASKYRAVTIPPPSGYRLSMPCRSGLYA